MQRWRLSEFGTPHSETPPDACESLVLALQAVLDAGGVQVDYDELCAVLGLSFMVCAPQALTTPLDDWPTYGRDVRLVEVASTYGLRLRDLHPPEAARDLDRTTEFAQHFDASYRPLVVRALENGQPVLAWRGWAGAARNSWGIITSTADSGIGLAGCTAGTDAAVSTLVEPPAQLYVAEELRPRQPGHGEVLSRIIDSASHVLSNRFSERWGITTGPAALGRWSEQLAAALQVKADHETLAAHARAAARLVATRRTGVDVLNRFSAMTESPDAERVPALLSNCRALIDALAPASDIDRVMESARTDRGRGQLLAGLRTARAVEERARQAAKQTSPPT